MYKYLLLLTAIIMASPSQAEFTTNMGAATKYVYRGIKQSNADIVLNAGMDYQGPLGLYVGAWGYTGSIEHLDTSELNTYGGLAYSLAGVSFGVGAIRYERGGDKLDNTEYNVNVAWDAYRLSTYQDEDSQDQYHEIAANYNIWGDSGLVITYGKSFPDADDAVSRWNYSFGWVKAMPSNVDFELMFTRHQRKGNSLTISMTQQIDW